MEAEDINTGLLAAALIGELRRLVTEVEARITDHQAMSALGSLQLVAARADDLAHLQQESFMTELQRGTAELDGLEDIDEW